MNIKVQILDELHVGRSTTEQGEEVIEFEVPALASEQIVRAIATLTKGLPYEHLTIHVSLLNDNGQEIRSHKVPLEPGCE
jgi:hypothetical protein